MTDGANRNYTIKLMGKPRRRLLPKVHLRVTPVELMAFTIRRQGGYNYKLSTKDNHPAKAQRTEQRALRSAMSLQLQYGMASPSNKTTFVDNERPGQLSGKACNLVTPNDH